MEGKSTYVHKISLVKVKMIRRRDGLRKWFQKFPERLVIFTLGLLFSKGMMTFVMGYFITFLTDFWNLKLKDAAAIVNLREGLKNILQIYIALRVDDCLGYRRMLILSSVLYSAGLGLLAYSAPQYFFDNDGVCPAEKVDCFKMLKHTPFWEGFALLIAGGAAQVIPLHSLSFDQTKAIKVPKDYEPTRVKFGCCLFKVNIRGWRHLQQRFLRLLCYASLMLGTVISVYGLISYDSKWHERFLISAISIVVGLLWFLCGFHFYGPRRLQPNPFSAMLRVFVAAVRKRHLNYRDNPEQLHRGDEDDQNQLLTDHLECLNNAALGESSSDEETRRKCCTVKEVEEAKLLLNIIPMSLTFIVYGMVKSLGNTFFAEQAYGMTGGIFVVFQIIQYVSKIAVNNGYKLVIEKRIERIKKRYSDGVKIGLVLFPGSMEGLAGDGIQDFFGHYTPYSRRYGPVFTNALTGSGTLLNIGFITVLDYYSESRYKKKWLGESINESRLDIIYRAYIIVALVNWVLYAYVATRYSYDNIMGRPEEEEEIPFLEVKEEEGEEGEGQGDQQDNQGQVSIDMTRMPLR
ncbi:hypothetical protein PTKIN_Ptkin17bG0146000 [Pterospermum kingtungense]